MEEPADYWPGAKVMTSHGDDPGEDQAKPEFQYGISQIHAVGHLPAHPILIGTVHLVPDV